MNNVQLEGRRINVEISKNGGGRRDHNGRSCGGFGGGRVLLQEEKFCTKKKVQVVLETIETLLRRWFRRKKLSSKRRWFWRKKLSSEQGSSTELDVLKVLVTRTKKTKKRLTFIVNFLIIIREL
jgi:hypothetical protein